MAGEDPRYCAYLRTQPCARCGVTYGIEVHHPLWATTYSPEEARPAKAIEGAKKGKSQKCHDHFALPLCFAMCHVPGIHRGGGHFAGTSPEEREAWEREQITIHRNRYAMQQPAPAAASRSEKRKRGRPGAGWSVAGVLDLLRKEARHRTGEVSAAFTELADLIERDTV